MQQAFDTLANCYDATFTNSIIGTAQREIVWNYLEKNLPVNKKLSVFELNCGTGEDALWFAKHGHKVLASDISEKMLDVLRKKIYANNFTFKIKTLNLDITNISDTNFDEKFDLVFSNFGGMNCISPSKMNNVAFQISELLNAKSRLIMILMPRFCLWETNYFLLKLNLKNAFRRFSDKGTLAKLNGEELKTFYYSPSQIKKYFEKYFEVMAVKSVGFFIPPSYMEKFFATKQKTFNFLKRAEDVITNHKYLAGFSDHFLIDFKVKK
jgi:ubiquinone/menaquinone biosynthesis C-methylase UbiE